MRKAVLFAVLGCLVALGGYGGHAGTSGPCGRVPPGSVSYRHVIWIWMENHGYAEVVGSGSAPYLNGLARECGLATDYHAVTHPSLPNYVAATSGLGGSALNRFLSDCNPSHSCSTKARSLFAQAPSWRAFEESMPKRCLRSDSGLYAVRHNPPPYFRALRGCRRHDVPFTAFTRALRSGSLPAFSFVTPNLCDDSHDCPLSTGDHWLARHVPKIVASRAYRHTVVFITFDESDGSSNRVATFVVSPSTRAGTRAGHLFSHYSLLRTTEDLLHLHRLGNARHAAGMARAFGL